MNYDDDYNLNLRMFLLLKFWRKINTNVSRLKCNIQYENIFRRQTWSNLTPQNDTKRFEIR